MNLRRLIRVLVVLLLYLSTTSQAVKQDAGSVFHFGGTGGFEITGSGKYSVTFRYLLPDVTLSAIQRDEGDFFSLIIPGHHGLNDPGKPELPVISKLLQVPEFEGFKVEYRNVKSTVIRPETKNLTGKMFPSQEARPKSDTQQRQRFMIDTDVYRSNRFTRSDTIMLEHTGKMRDINLATITFIPARYNPVANIIEVITSAEIVISFTPSAMTGATGSPENPVADASKGVKSFSPEQLINGYTSNPAGMIILTDTTYRKQLEPLVKWKTQKGFRVTTIYRGETLAGTSFEQLRDTIRKVYNATLPGQTPPDFLLIVGDRSRIPTATTDFTTRLSDMYYGEFDGDGDFIPEMYIGRIPARDTAEVRAATEKIIMYEKQQFADTSSFWLRSLITAGNDASYITYMNGQLNYASAYYLNAENGINGTSLLSPRPDTAFREVRRLLNSGVGFMNYSGHGATDRWILPTIISSQTVDSLTNTGMYPFIISNACQTGNFSTTANLATKFVVASGKGAVGFIGCTGDSYWAEDYHYAVGVGPVSLNPVYDTDNLGFYDRLFHKNGELPSQWYYTMGQVNIAGLMAVSASTSNRKRYYWESYALIGDPSVIPVIGPQMPIEINLPETLPTGLRTLHLEAPPFTYAAISDFNTLWDASHVSPSGYVTLKIPENAGDSCLVVISGQGYRTYIRTLRFGDYPDSWLNVDDIVINDDIIGNGDGRADYSETFYLTMKVGNLGNKSSSDAWLKISADSEWITIISDSVFIGDIPAKGTFDTDKAFLMKLADNIPDKSLISIRITSVDSDTTMEYVHDIMVHAPSLSILSLKYDDTVKGNGNLLPDRGESLDLVFTVRNTGSSQANGEMMIINSPAGLSYIEPSVSTGPIPPGESIEIRVPATVSEYSPPGTLIPIESRIDCGFYSGERLFEISIGQTRESFEYGSFSIFPWINSSPVPWIITETQAFDQTRSAMSGPISHNGSTSLRINIDLPAIDTLRFWYKVSSEANYDFFRFTIYSGSDTIRFRDSGEKDWTRYTVVLQPGPHMLEWSYTKDGNTTRGLDRAWIDLIDFPKNAFAIRDIELSGFVSPATADEYGEEYISVVVRNLGSGTIDGFNLAYMVNDYISYSQYFPAVISFRDSAIVTFDRPVSLNRYGIYDIVVYSFNNDDDFSYNDTISIRIENTMIKAETRAYPNPFTGNLNIFISSQADDDVTISVIDMTGRKQFSSQAYLSEGGNTINLPLQLLSPGTYLITIKGSITDRRLKVLKL